MAEELKVSKRNILHMLGVAPVSVAALTVQPEDFNRPLPGYDDSKSSEVSVSNMVLSKYHADKMALALEKLAENVRARRVMVNRFHIGTTAVGNDELHGSERLVAPKGWTPQQIMLYQEWYEKQPPGSVRVLPYGMRVERPSHDQWLSQTLTIDLSMLVKDEPVDDKERPFANREGFYQCSGCRKEFTIKDKKLVVEDGQAWHIECVDVSTLPVKDALGLMKKA